MRPLPASSAIQWQALLHQCPPDFSFWRSRMVQWTEMVQSGDLLAAAQVVYEVVDRSSVVDVDGLSGRMSLFR